MRHQFIETHSKRKHSIHDPCVIQGSIEQFLEQMDPINQQIHGISAGSVVLVNANARRFAVKTFTRRGLVAKIIRHHYLWRPYPRSRMWREFLFLARLRQLELPVPTPVAAICQCQIPFTYSGKLITECIADTVNLRDLLRAKPLTNHAWASIGQTIAIFHHFDVYHADLNAANILIQQQSGRCFLVDFDKCMILRDKAAKARNLTRLYRSLKKLNEHQSLNFNETNWKAFLTGYQKKNNCFNQNI